MATPTRDYRYSVEFNIHAVDAPGTRLIKQGNIYLNICLLGTHRQSRPMPSYLPMHVDQKLHFDKVFKFCYEPQDVIERLEREHVLIELIQSDFPTPILLASYEACAKDFLYPYAWDRLEYTGLRRYVLLNRTIEFPGISPTFEFSVSPYVDDVANLPLPSAKSAQRTRTIRRARSPSPSLRLSSSFTRPSRYDNSANLSSSVTSHTISSALKNDHAKHDTKDKLQDLAVPYDVSFVLPKEKSKSRPPFVVRHTPFDITGRKPVSHTVLNDGLVVNDYTLSRENPSLSVQGTSLNRSRSRSVSPALDRSSPSMGRRSRSPSPARRSPSPSRRYQPAEYEDYVGDSGAYARSLSRRSLSPTLHRDSFRYRYGYSPATDLSDKVIYTLRRNLDYYGPHPWYRYYYTYGYLPPPLVADLV